MDALECIYTRRSVRQFIPGKPVAKDTVEKLLRAAMAAPSAGNGQPWHFVVVTDRAKLDAVAGFSPYAQMCKQASLGILVCADLKALKYDGAFWQQDCSAATQNILLAAHALGLGAVWTASHPWKDRSAGYRKLLGIPETIEPLCFIPIGYPAQQPAPEDRYKKDRVHENGW